MSKCCDLMDCNLPGSLSKGFPRQEYWSELLFPSLGDLPHPGIKPTSPALQVDFLPLSHQGAEQAMASHSSTTLAWKIPWTEEPGRLQFMGSLGSDGTERLHFHFSLSCIGKGNGNPLQCSCLENPRDGEAWWAATYGVAKSWPRLK